MTFFLPILVNLKYKLWLAIIKKNFSNKKLLANIESDTDNSTALSSYKREKVKTLLDFVNKDKLAYTAWAKIQKKVTKTKNI